MPPLTSPGAAPSCLGKWDSVGKLEGALKEIHFIKTEKSGRCNFADFIWC